MTKKLRRELLLMITDSPYEINDLILPPLAGLVAAVIASFVMLIVVALLQPYSGISVETVLRQFAALVLPKRFAQLEPAALIMIGLGVHIVIRGLIGLLYSVSQQRVPAKGYIAVGIFFGFIIWLFGSVVAGFFFGDEWRSASRTWTWLLANLIFGLCLAMTTIIAEKIRPPQKIVVPKD